MDSFMTVQSTFCGKCFAAFGATQSSFKSGALISSLHTFHSELPLNCTLNLHKILSCLGFNGQSSSNGDYKSLYIADSDIYLDSE